MVVYYTCFMDFSCLAW